MDWKKTGGSFDKCRLRNARDCSLLYESIQTLYGRGIHVTAVCRMNPDIIYRQLLFSHAKTVKMNSLTVPL
jgi:hypothetical protein